MRRHIPAAAILSLAATALLGGCNTGGGSRADAGVREPSIDINSSHKQIMVGESTTLTVASRNTVGHDAEVRWTSTGGNVEPIDNGQIARATFDQPGTYTVTATLLLDGREVSRDSVDVSVRPIR